MPGENTALGKENRGQLALQGLDGVGTGVHAAGDMFTKTSGNGDWQSKWVQSYK